MIRLIRYLVLFIFFSIGYSSAFAQFPYFESFRTSSRNGIIVGGAPSAFLTAGGSSETGGTPIDPEGDGYLRLTNASRDQKGFAYSTSSFPSVRGLRVEFEYYIYGGNGADGISFFLFDSNANPFTIGGFGGSLGYAQYTKTTPTSVGVSGGYIGVGLDEYGNFSNPTEGRQGGTGFMAGSITLRGKGNGDALTPTNYPFLTTVRTADKGIPLAGNDSRRFPETTSDAYRKVFIEMEPNPAGGYFVTVRLTQGGPNGLNTVTMIDRYPYTTAAPSNLKYGFASSTGDNTNFHEVRNVAISVYDVNGLVAPTANNDAVNGCPNNQVSFDVTANDVSNNAGGSIQKNTIDLNPSTAGLQKTSTVVGKGMFTANDDGTITFVPSSFFTGPVSTTYTISDNFGVISSNATFTVNYVVPSVVANAGADIFINFAAPSVSTPLAGNNPGAGNTGIWTQVSGPSAAVFANNAVFNTIASNLIGGVYTFRWTVTVSGGCSTSDDVVVNVNRRPNAVNDVVSTNLNTPFNIPILDNDTDPEGNQTIDVSSVVIISPPSNGTVFVDPATGIALYTPNNGYSGSDAFTYTVKDIRGLVSNFATVSIGVSVRPTGTNDNAVTLAGTPIVIPVANNDPSRSGTTVVEATLPVNGTIVVNPDNTITYTPNAGFSGRDPFTYKLRTPGGVESDPITVSVSVRPTGVADIGTTIAGVPLTSSIKDNDPSKTGTTVVPVIPPTNGTIVVNSSNTVTYTPNAGFSGKETYTYLLRTADGLESDAITVTINVRPVGTNDVVVTPINVPVAIPVKANDLSKTGTSVVLGTPPLHGTLALNNTTGVVTFTPTAGYAGPDSFTYILRTADGLDSDPITVAITIKPVGTNDEVTTPTNTPITISVKDNDVSKTGTTVAVVGPAANGTTTVGSDGKVLYSPATDFSGKDLFTYTLTTVDGAKSDPITVIVNVKPVGLPDNVGAVTGVTQIDVKANDPSKQNTTVVINTTPASGTVSVNSAGIVTYTPNAGFTGTDVFTYTLRTPDGLVSDPITVTLTSNPAGSPDVATTPAKTPVTIPVKDNDLSKTGTTVVLVGPPLNGTVALNGNNLPVYTPFDAFSGKDTFTYKLRDANGLESTPITVTVNVKPVGTADNVTTPLNTTVTITIKNNDASSLGTTPIIVSNPAHGMVSIDGSGNAVFVPTTGYTGNDVFTYKLRTTDGIESDPINVTVAINPVVPAPDIILPATTGTPVIVPIPVVQPGGIYIIVTPPKHGTITTDPSTGRPIYTPTPNYSGPDDFTYTLKDPNGVTSTPGKVTITVTRPAKIGLAKSLISTVRNPNGSYRLVYLFNILNLGDVALEKISLTDDLAGAFPGKAFTITRLNASGTLRVNTLFNGGAVKEMLLTTSTLAANQKEQVELEVSIAANQTGGSFVNSALTQGFAAGTGTLTMDISTDGLSPDPITPGDVTPQVPTVVLLTPNIILPVNAETPKLVDIPVPTGGSYIITKQPAHGRISTDPVTGKPIYTPDAGYTGPDDFTYIIRDANGNESQPAIVTVTVSTPAKIGLAKAVKTLIRNLDGTYNLTYTFTLKNYGNFGLERVALSDNLALAFPGTIVEVLSASATGTLRINNAYSGLNATGLLLNSSTLAANATETITLSLRLVLDTEEGTFNNFAIAEGYGVNTGTLTQDQSTNGLIPDPDPAKPGDVSPSELTQVTLLKEPMKIPGGFSPNGDGINDFFVIENALSKVINLEVYNRWGNRIYRSKDYKNTWDGRTTEGIYVGSEVPVGTYYYTIIIDGKDRKVGVLTINR
ncbi:Ig-like domain-containing protein [Pedobacter sp. JCM 36344]|uniref:Ig-like domain-containing protein n=1 Tax=Pedobacter sp. JCM 36344 TaxID=3374280 RepID=UPI003979C502